MVNAQCGVSLEFFQWPGGKRLKLRLKLFALLFGLMLSNLCYAQDPSGPQPKRARTPEDYKPLTLHELATKAASPDSRGNKEETMVVDPDISPSRVRASYAEQTRRLPEIKQEVVRQWSRLYAGSLDTYKPYEVEVLFSAHGSKYWLTFKKDTLDRFWEAVRKDAPFDLFVIRMGSAKMPNGWELVLLVENFEKIEPK